MRLGILFTIYLAGLGPVSAETGIASTYTDFDVACPGKHYSPVELTASHRSLPCGSFARVKNLKTKREVVVEIIDRSPHLPSGRIIDLTPAAAKAIRSDGLAPVEVTPIKARPNQFIGFEALWANRIGL